MGVPLGTKYNTCPSARTGSASLNYHAGSLFTWFPAEGSHIPSGADIAPGRAAGGELSLGKSLYSRKINSTREKGLFLRGKNSLDSLAVATHVDPTRGNAI